MQSLSWKIALTGSALISLGAWSCQRNGSSPDAASQTPQAWEAQQPGMQQPGTQQPGTQQPGTQQQGMQQQGMQQQGTQQPGMQQQGMQQPSPRDQQPGGQAAGTSQTGQGMQPGEQSSQRWPVAGQQPPMGACPMFVEGTEVEVSDTPDGVALEFTTQDGSVSDLRQRVQNLAQMYLMKTGRSQLRWFPARGQRGGQGSGDESSARGAGMGHGGGMGPGAGRGMGMGQLPPTTAMVSEIPDGARIELQPTSPQALSDLRQQVRQHAERLNSGQCWMMSSQPSGESPGRQGSQSPSEPGR